MREQSEKEKGESAISPPTAVRKRRQVRGERPLGNPQRRGSHVEKRFRLSKKTERRCVHALKSTNKCKSCEERKWPSTPKRRSVGH